jgi:hypothetical protein
LNLPADVVYIVERPPAPWWRPQLRALLAKIRRKFAAGERPGQKSDSILR